MGRPGEIVTQQRTRTRTQRTTTRTIVTQVGDFVIGRQGERFRSFNYS